MTPPTGSNLEIEHDGTTVALAGPVVTVGRSKDATLRVIHPLVSRLHCRIEFGEEGVFISDLESANGTHVNGVAVKSPVRIVRGDAITLGKEGALIRVRRAEVDGRDMLDPDLGSQATMIVGDPRARDIAARMELGGGATEQRTLDVAPPAPKGHPTPRAPSTPPAPPTPSAAPPAGTAGLPGRGATTGPRPPGPPPRPKDAAAAPATPTPPKPDSARPPSPAARPTPVRPPGPPPRPRDVAPPPPERDRSPATVSMVPLPDVTEEAPLPDDIVPELLDRTEPADRTVEAEPVRPKDIYTVMPIESDLLDAAKTSPISASMQRELRALESSQRAAEDVAAGPAVGPVEAKPGGLVAGLVVGLATGVAVAYGVSLLIARGGS